jgi:hypothetical protein
MTSKIEARKTQLLANFLRVRLEILAAARLTPLENLDEPFVGNWSLLDLLAHLSGWDEDNLSAIAALQSGALPEFYQYYDRDWQSYNALLVERFRCSSLGEQVTLVETTHTALLAYLESLPAPLFERDFGVRFKGIRVSISRLVAAELHDETIHLDQINRWLASPADPVDC